MKKVLVRFRGAREKGHRGIYGMPGGLARRPAGRVPCGERPWAGAWDRMARLDFLVGCVKAMVVSKEPPASTLYPAQRRDGALSPTTECSTRHWLDLFTRENCSLLLRHMVLLRDI